MSTTPLPPQYACRGLLNHRPFLAMVILAVSVAIFFIAIWLGGWSVMLSVIFYLCMALLGAAVWYLLEWHSFSRPAVTVEGRNLVFGYPESAAGNKVGLADIATVELNSSLMAIEFINASDQSLYVYSVSENDFQDFYIYLKHILPRAKFIEK